MLRELANQEPAWDIAKIYPPQGQWDIADYLAVDSNRLIEFSNGTIEVLPMPSIYHQRISRILFQFLFLFTQQHQLGEVFFAPTKVRLWDSKVREPDVFFVSAANLQFERTQWFERVDLVMEIISPDDPSRDLETKRREYAQAGIPEYWIIDPRSEEIMVLTLSDTQYQTHGVFSDSETATSVLLPTFEIPVQAVFVGKSA